MSDLPDALERELERHEAFDRAADDAYALTTTVFDAVVTGAPVAEASETADDLEETNETDAVRIVARVTVPSLEAAVTGETVAPVVAEGWLETFERRLADVFDVARTASDAEPTVEADGETVRVTLEYVARDAEQGVADAKALVEYVEGTYAQGLVPGYEYDGPAARLLENARERGQRGGDGGATRGEDGGSTPL